MRVEIRYGLKIDYDKHTDEAATIFASMSRLISSFRKIDEPLAKSINSEIQYSQTLDSVSEGSMTSWLLDKIIVAEKIDLSEPPENKQIIKYVRNGRKAVIAKVGSPSESSDRRIVNEIEIELDRIADETGINKSINYVRPGTLVVAEAVEELSSTVNCLASDGIGIFPCLC